MKNLIILFFISSIAFGCSKIKSYEEAKVLADKIESNSANQQHQSNVLVPYFTNNYSSVLKDCFSKVKSPDASTFNMILVISKDGNIEKIYRDKETNIGICMFKNLKNNRFPKPIISPYYFHIEMAFN